MPSATILTQSDRELANIFKEWIRHGNESPQLLCHFLEYKYTGENLKLSRLVAKDQAMAAQMMKVEKRSKFMLLLATFEYMRSGGYEDYESAPIDDEFDSHTKLTKVVDVEGQQAATDVRVDESQLVQRMDFDDEEASGADFRGHTGNAGAEKPLWYRKAVSSQKPKVDTTLSLWRLTFCYRYWS